MTAVREATPEEVVAKIETMLHDEPRLANEVVSVGIPILLSSGEILRGQDVIVPAEADHEPITPEKLEAWVHDGWVDLRVDNCASWIDRMQRIHDDTAAIPTGDTSSRHLRNVRFWDEEKRIQPGKILGWILSVEEHGARFKH